MAEILIVDYGLGNLGSIRNMLKKIGVAAEVSSEPAAVEGAERLILPGVGAFDAGMRNLAERGLVEPLNRAVLGQGTPVLGICLGMQLMARMSEEGNLPGLGWIDARCLRFRFEGPARLRVPHMGWNTVRCPKESPLFARMPSEPRFYFVHSYYVACEKPDDVTAIAQYGLDFAAAVERGNIRGVQFHPEKSHRFGMELLRSFAELR